VKVARPRCEQNSGVRVKTVAHGRSVRRAPPRNHRGRSTGRTEEPDARVETRERNTAARLTGEPFRLATPAQTSCPKAAGPAAERDAIHAAVSGPIDVGARIETARWRRSCARAARRLGRGDAGEGHRDHGCTTDRTSCAPHQRLHELDQRTRSSDDIAVRIARAGCLAAMETDGLVDRPGSPVAQEDELPPGILARCAFPQWRCPPSPPSALPSGDCRRARA
jgi:hypothetical protein